MAEEARSCKNCGTVSEGWYCTQCGQRLSVHKVTFRETLEDLADAFFSVNAPLFRTVRDMILRPGNLLRNYLDGKRRRYYRPVAFFLLMTFLYIVIRSLIGFDPFRDSTVVVEGDQVTASLLTEARNFMLININNFLFVFVMTLALFMKLFFFKRYSLAEYIAVSFYLLGIYTILVTGNMFMVQYVGDYLQPLGITIMWLYFIFAMVTFLQRPAFWVGLKSIFVFLLAFITYGMTSFGLSYLIVLSRQG
ncbi:DUF3667 domain-containing protein [Muriicola marianensis]|uniref:DUF3667 domain-containing protein n=1 Tax=Muriicola marianensis TaxID=1324801 RepID=A0ABQ1QW98_9FLAO|nr:DUF3667 domain-containing protein [Muriicola marianensis]GGD47105.1 hypothetical protein GCM10011361_12400 [Muriicola marianensis]